MKKFIYFIAGALFAFSITAFAATTIFTDQNTFEDWYEDAVINMHNKGIITGYSDGSFQAYNNVNRAELAVMLDRMFQYIEANKSSILSMETAKAIAEKSSCTEEGNLTGEYYYNDITKTWWFNTNIQKSGCNPTCVVDEETKTAEINWMCTGAL
ncbi:hypothetical protein A2335_02555 [Candidatus Peregrinibacteria bacterium RIFOXYB2_FULL_32_7]|nr:MAG: hypothetical protein A2335_02555 [Candidatus Peregrinibacteria bacterium RIFOXYB2_FULL_32_7]